MIRKKKIGQEDPWLLIHKDPGCRLSAVMAIEVFILISEKFISDEKEQFRFPFFEVVTFGGSKMVNDRS
jgi:hypothetical protein